jgi:hypothetical protein
MDRSLGNDLSRVIAASVCDHRLGYQHARRTGAIATLDFLHHVLGDDFQQTLFAFGHSAWLDALIYRAVARAKICLRSPRNAL